MNGSGIGSLMAGFQQGFGFADDLARKRKHDEREDKRFAREQKQWGKEDDYDAELKDWRERNGLGKPAQAASPQLIGDDDGNPLPQGPAAPNVAGLAEPGNIDLAKRPVVKNADGSISTVRSMSFNVDGKEVLIPTVSDDGRIMSDDEALQTYKTTGKHLGKFDTPDNATAYANSLHNDQDRMYSATPAPANAPMAAMGTNPVPQPAVSQSPANAAVAALGTQPPKPAAAPTSAAGLPAELISNPANLLRAAKERMMIDVKHGKMDGVGLLNGMKLLDGIKRENQDTAIKLLNAGRTSEAMELFNSSGDHKAELVSVEDGKFKIGKTEVPTKIAVLRNADGSTSTVNTAQWLDEMQDFSKRVEQVQRNRQLDVTETHYNNTEKESERHHQATERSSAATAAAAHGTLQLNRDKFEYEKKAAGGLTMEKVDKAGANMLKHFESVYSPKDGMTPEEKNVLGAKAKALAASSMAAYKTSWALGNKISELDAMQAVQLAQDPKNLVQRAHTDGQKYPGVMVNGTFVPVGGAIQAAPAPAPAPAPGPKPVAAVGTQPAAPYQPPANSQAGQVVAQRQAVLQAQQQKIAAAQQGFAADAQSLSPADLVRKYPDMASRALLTPEQKVLLQQAARQL